MGPLNLLEKLLHCIKIQFGSGPTITFKLTKQINIDNLIVVEYFEFERKLKGLHQIEENEEPTTL